MLTGFEKETAPLTDYERETLLPIMVKCLSVKHGADLAVKNATICRKLTALGYDISEARVRKLVNHIRVNGLVPCLMASSRGYFIAGSIEELDVFIGSLQGREDAIRQVRLAMQEQRDAAIAGRRLK